MPCDYNRFGIRAADGSAWVSSSHPADKYIFTATAAAEYSVRHRDAADIAIVPPSYPADGNITG